MLQKILDFIRIMVVELQNIGYLKKKMTDDELKALVASLAVDSKNLHEAQKATALLPCFT